MLRTTLEQPKLRDIWAAVHTSLASWRRCRKLPQRQALLKLTAWWVNDWLPAWQINTYEHRPSDLDTQNEFVDHRAWMVVSGPIHTGREDANFRAIPLMLLASSTDTPIRDRKFHLLAFAPQLLVPQCLIFWREKGSNFSHLTVGVDPHRFFFWDFATNHSTVCPWHASSLAMQSCLLSASKKSKKPPRPPGSFTSPDINNKGQIHCGCGVL